MQSAKLVLPGGSVVKNPCQCRRYRFDPWVGKMPRRRKWQPTPVFLPRKFQGQRSLMGYSLWGGKESDTTDHTHTRTHTYKSQEKEPDLL